MLNLNDVRRLRAMDPARIVSERGDAVRRRFAADGLPVVIAARNEEADLPATLLTLAASTVPVAPMVVVNGTTDATAERAERMGARVLQSRLSFKMAALQLGVATAFGERRRGPILFTDADTLVGPTWAPGMAAAGRAWTRPVVTLGNSVFTHGESHAADLARSARKVILAELRERRGLRPLAHGHNMAVDFAGSQRALDNYLSIDPARFIGEEEEIVDRIVEADGEWRSALGAATIVITRGDRFTFADLWRMRSDPDFEQRRTRYAEYTGIKPFLPGRTSAPAEESLPAGTVSVLDQRRRA